MFRFKLKALFCVLCIALCWMLMPSNALAQTDTPTSIYQIQQADGSVLEGEVFDLSQMTVDDFSPIDITDPQAKDQLSEISPHIDLSHLAPGNLVASQDYLTVRMLDTAFGLGDWSLANIAARTGTNIQAVPLSAYGEAIGNLTLGELANHVPEFGAQTANQSPIFLAAIKGFQAATGSPLSLDQALNVRGYDRAYSIEELLRSSNPIFSDIQLNILGDQLNQWSVIDIPGLSFTPIKELDTLEEAFIGDLDVLGITDKLSFSQFPRPPVLNDIIRIGRFDVPLGEPEHDRVRVVSGGVTKGDRFNGQPCHGGGCVHVELDEVGMPPSSGLSGFAWMTSDHRVPDGYGILCIPFGCTGPAGNHPFGKGFRVLFNNLNEAEGSVQISISFRACARFWFIKSCTPYIFPTPKGIPLGKIHEKAIFPVTPPNIQLSGQDYNYRDYSGYGSGAYGRSSPCLSGGVSGAIVDHAIEALSTVPLYNRQGRLVGQGWDRAGVQQHAPLLIGAALEQGITDPAHIAYILATAGHESLFKGPIEEFESGWRRRTGAGDYGAVHPETGHRYYGRGYVQVTWAANYKKIDRILGTDTYNNPEQMLDPAISAAATVIGMRDGIFTNRRLDDYGRGDNFDWNGARTIINDGDLRSTIGGYAHHIYEYIKNTDANAVQKSGETQCSGSGEVGSPIAGVSIQDALAYNVASFQDFKAYRAYRNAYHGGIDFDYRIGMGEGGQVTSVADGEIRSIVQIASNQTTGEPSVSVRVVSLDSQGNEIEQRYTHLSIRAVEAALGCGIGQCVGQPIRAGQHLGNVGGDDTVSNGAHLDYKVKVNGRFVHPLEYLAAINSGGGTVTTMDLSSGRTGTATVGGFAAPATASSP